MRHSRFSSYIILICVALLTSACTDEATLGGDWSPSLTPRQLLLSAYDMKMLVEGGTETVNVTAENAGWDFDGNDASWLTLTPKSGNGNAIVTLTAQPNTDPITGRSIAYAFTCTDADWPMMRQFSVSQSAAGYYIRPAEKNFTKTATATQFEVGIEANSSWEANSDAEWLTVQTTPISLTIKLTDNNTSLTTDRIGHITLTCGNATEIVTVNQHPHNITVTDEELVYDPEGGDKSVVITSDVAWTANCSKSWITLSTTKGMAGTTSLLIHAAPNTSINDRTANVYVSIGGKGLHSIPIRQQGAYINVSTTSLPAFPYQGGNRVLTIKANTDWALIDKPAFVTISPKNGGKGDTKVTVSTTENSNEKSFSGDIIFGNVNITGLQAKVHVEQECANIGISEQTITVGSTAGSKHQLTLTTNQSWTAAFKSSTWAHLSATSGNGSTTLTLTADDNPSINQREDILTITPAVTKTPLTFRFVQRGKTLEVSPTSLSILPEGGTSEPIVVSTDGTYSVTQSGEWFTITRSGNNITVNAQENTTNSIRTGSVIVTLTNLPEGEKRFRTVSIKQDMTDLDYDSPTNLWRSVDEGTNFVSVTPWFCDNGWGQIADPAWSHVGYAWSFIIPEGMGGSQWQGQFPINTALTAAGDKTYNFSCTINSDEDLPGVTIKLAETDEKGKKHDNNFFFTDRHNVKAHATFKYTIKGVKLAEGTDAHALTLFFDFGGCPIHSYVEISNIVFEEAGTHLKTQQHAVK